MLDNRSLYYQDYQPGDYKSLWRYVDQLARHKLGYPVSLLTYLGIVDNRVLGIQRGSLANVLLNNVGDPFVDSETSLLEVKRHEREVISILERYYGLEKGDVRGYVTTGGTEGNFASLWWTKRYLINMGIDKLIAIDNAMKLEVKQEQELMAELARIPISNVELRLSQLQKIIDIKNNIDEKKNMIQQVLTPTLFYSRGPTHYSIPKIAEILRLNIRPVAPNDDGSINLDEFKKELIFHLGAHPHSPVMVIANIGTTVSGAIDNVPAIHQVLTSTPTKLIYSIHMDGALTGFVLPIIKPFGDVKNYFDAIGVNTMAVSAHKYPGLSQPCGIILARRQFFDKAFEKSERNIEYVGNIVDVTITGSRSGLNVLMFYNALCYLGIDKNNDRIIKLVKENIDNADYLTERLKELFGDEEVSHKHQFNVSFPRPSRALARKYQLMLTGDKATICVLSNVTRKLINQFISDLKIEKEINMGSLKANTDYTIETLQEQYAKEVTDLFVKNFCDSEPITKHLNIRYHDYEPFAKEVVSKAVKEGLSKVILDHNHRVIACAIAEDMADPFIPHAAHYPKLYPIFSLIEELSKPFTEGRKFVRGKILHIWIALVDSAYRGKGLSTIVDMSCIEQAAHKGFDYAYTEFTNDISEKVAKQFNTLQVLNKIKYDDFALENGRKPFSGLAGSAVSYVATIRPGVSLNNLSHCYKTLEKYTTEK